jgi:Tol biopolymer transport system component
MHNLPASLKRSFWIVFLLLFTGCGPNAPITAPTQNFNTIITQAAPTVVVEKMQIATSQPTATLTLTIPATETSLPTTTLSPAGTPEPTEPVVIVPGLRVAYTIEGNLYVQDSGGQPVQLTHSGADSEPMISDDGQKLVFLRSKPPNNRRRDLPFELYSINADGSQERVLIVPELLMAIDSKIYNQFSEVFSSFFVPGTHRLLFKTHQFNPNGDYYMDMGANYDLLIVDTDNGKTRQILAPGQVNRFALSPNGQRLAVQRIKGGGPYGQIDILGTDGKIIREDIFRSMFPDDPSRYGQDFVAIHWSSDGSRLMAVPGYDLDLPRYGRVIWQYSMTNGAVMKTDFNPPPVTSMFAISPDGNWVVYTYYDAIPDEDGIFGVYLGNLRTGEVRKLGSREVYGTSGEYTWSPNNTHFFFFNDYLKGFIGDNRGNVEPSCHPSSFIDWIDSRRYLCGRVLMGELGKENLDWVVQIPDDFPHISEITFVLLKNQTQTGK